MPRTKIQKQALILIPAIFLLLTLLICGCGKKEETHKTDGAKGKEKSNARILLEGITGKSAVDRGRKAQDTIRNISEERNKQLDQTMNR